MNDPMAEKKEWNTTAREKALAGMPQEEAEWEKKFDETFKHSQFVPWSAIKAFIRQEKEKSYQQGCDDYWSRFIEQGGYRVGYAQGARDKEEEVIAEVKKKIEGYAFKKNGTRLVSVDQILDSLT